MKIVMAPANHTYLDQKYIVTARSSVPPSLGMNWACPAGCDVSSAYNWNPGGFVSGVTDRNVIGVEGDMWSETVATLSNVDYMVFPRLLALAEVAWSPAARRTATSPAYRDFLLRLAAQGARLQAAGVNFYPSAQVPWPLTVIGDTVTASARGRVHGPVATLSAPGFPTSTLTDVRLLARHRVHDQVGRREHHDRRRHRHAMPPAPGSTACTPSPASTPTPTRAPTTAWSS